MSTPWANHDQLSRDCDRAASQCSYCHEWGHDRWHCIQNAMARIACLEEALTTLERKALRPWDVGISCALTAAILAVGFYLWEVLR